MKKNQEKRNWSKYLVYFGFLCIFGLWAALLYRSFSIDVLQFTYQHPADYKLPSYTMNKMEYNQYASLYVESILPTSQTSSYPKLFPLVDLLKSWPSAYVGKGAWQRSVAHPRYKNSLYRLNYMNDSERQIAFQLRDLDLPYILYNVPELDNAAVNEFSITNLLNHLSMVPRMVEKSESQKFMYYTMKNPILTSRRFPSWKAPQSDILMTFPKFLGEVESAENSQSDIVGETQLHYMTISASEGGRTQWIRTSLPFFEPEESLFMKEPNMYRGVNCRFGMKGVTAAAHYDSRRNYIAMIRGRKRYILLPPGECPKLDLYSRGHPSVRHSQVDWTNLTAVQNHEGLSTALATEVILSMGEILYLPSFWFHYIISQDASIQCNARSGESVTGKKEISECGFLARSEIKDHEEDRSEEDVSEEEEADKEEKQPHVGSEGKSHLLRHRPRTGRRSKKNQFEWSTGLT